MNVKNISAFIVSGSKERYSPIPKFNSKILAELLLYFFLRNIEIVTAFSVAPHTQTMPRITNTLKSTSTLTGPVESVAFTDVFVIIMFRNKTNHPIWSNSLIYPRSQMRYQCHYSFTNYIKNKSYIYSRCKDT